MQQVLSTNGLSGLILSSTNPERLASFYRDVLGIPLQLNKHGKLPAHWECDFNGVHFAILKESKTETGASNIVPSFAVEDINAFVEYHHLSMLHPIMSLGGGSYVASIADTDGNVIRLWMGN